MKAIGRTAQEFRASKEKQIDQGIETKALITLPHPYATSSYIPILTFISFIGTFNLIISIFSSCIADIVDPHFQTSVLGDLSSCKSKHLTQQTASNQADTVIETFASTDSIRPFKIPGNWPEAHYKSRSQHPLVLSHLLPDRFRK